MSDPAADPLFAATVAERQRLAGLLRELTDEQWSHDSLCERWRVRWSSRSSCLGPDRTRTASSFASRPSAATAVCDPL